jgi:hypothetical protein
MTTEDGDEWQQIQGQEKSLPERVCVHERDDQFTIADEY